MKPEAGAFHNSVVAEKGRFSNVTPDAQSVPSAARKVMKSGFKGAQMIHKPLWFTSHQNVLERPANGTAGGTETNIAGPRTRP